jgi:hypothetical protein
VELPAFDFTAPAFKFQDALSETLCLRSSSELRERGLFLDLSPGEAHLFLIE